MKTPQPILNLLNKPMDRKEFLRHIGVGGLLLMGGGLIVNALGGFSKLAGDTSADRPRTASGYGTSVYGGHKS